MLSLINDPWLPARDRAGRVRRIRPIDLLDESIIELAWPRADFQGAAYQLLIGLLQGTVPPADREEWEEVWDEGIDERAFAAGLEQLAPAFAFGAQKPSFMQDMATLEGDPLRVANLLIEAPGDNTRKLNKDHFVKRGVVEGICPCCCAIALFTLQINAPSGGQGHRTSLRGGGPLTTLVWPKEPETPLWRRLWLNVLTTEQMPASMAVDASRFPWCGSTRTSEQASSITTPERVHPQQVYWGMPRRIEIDFSAPRAGCCSLCGEQSEQLLDYYRTKNYGVQYDGWAHPLTPYRQDLKDPTAPLLSVKGQPGGLLYKEWLGLIWQGASEQNRECPACVVGQAQGFRPDGVTLGLHCFGYDMDNMKARCWYQQHVPLPHVPPARQEVLIGWLRLALLGARDGLGLLKGAVKAAWYLSPKDARGDLSFIDLAFWQQTEPAFLRLLDVLLGSSGADPAGAALAHWHGYLHRELLQRFDDLVLTNPQTALDLSQELKARKQLFLGLGKSRAFRALIQPTPQEVSR